MTSAVLLPAPSFQIVGKVRALKYISGRKIFTAHWGGVFFFSSPSLSNIDKQPLNVIFLQTAFYFRLFKLSTQSRQRVNLSIKPRIYTAPFGNTMKTLPTFYNFFFITTTFQLLPKCFFTFTCNSEETRYFNLLFTTTSCNLM